MLRLKRINGFNELASSSVSVKGTALATSKARSKPVIHVADTVIPSPTHLMVEDYTKQLAWAATCFMTSYTTSIDYGELRGASGK